MSYWEILEERDDDGRDGFGLRNANGSERAYKEGFRHGYERAKEEMTGQRGGYDERRHYPEWPMGQRGGYDYDYDDMGERRRRRGNGQWY